jgi:hypothetical protein
MEHGQKDKEVRPVPLNILTGAEMKSQCEAVWRQSTTNNNLKKAKWAVLDRRVVSQAYYKEMMMEREAI